MGNNRITIKFAYISCICFASCTNSAYLEFQAIFLTAHVFELGINVLHEGVSLLYHVWGNKRDKKHLIKLNTHPVPRVSLRKNLKSKVRYLLTCITVTIHDSYQIRFFFSSTNLPMGDRDTDVSQQ